mgnify:CR=1 FL=1
MFTAPEVFIIESLEHVDETNDRYEGKLLSHILKMNGKQCIYHYIRTEGEFKEAVKLFNQCNYRYLHLSCHGNQQAMKTTQDVIFFDDLGEILQPYINNKRLFVSACDMVNENLAQIIIPKSGCYSIIGPAAEISFSSAAIFWASFYHLMFKYDFDEMVRKTLLKYCQHLAKLFMISINYYSISRTNSKRYKLTEIQ